MSWRSALFRSAAAGITALLLWSCGGTSGDILHVSYAYPVFYRLEVFGDRLTAVSPDLKTLRGLTFDGRELWRRSIVGDPLVARYDDAHLYVQEENTVLRLRVTDGTVERLFDVPEHQRFVRDRTNGLVYLIDQRFERNTFQLLNPDSRRPMWQREDIETILHVEQDLLVVATATREYDANQRSFSTRDVAVTGLDRRAGEVRWRVALNSNNGFVRAAALSACLVVIDEGAGGGLVCVDPASGRILGRRAHSTTWGLSYADVVPEGDHVAFLESGTSGGDMFLRFASVPSFEVTESLRLAGNEPTLSLHGNHVFIKGLYRAFCFDRQTGDPRWDRALVGEWKLLEDEILLSDYDRRRKHARLVMLNVASGRERVILSEPRAWRRSLRPILFELCAGWPDDAMRAGTIRGALWGGRGQEYGKAPMACDDVHEQRVHQQTEADHLEELFEGGQDHPHERFFGVQAFVVPAAEHFESDGPGDENRAGQNEVVPNRRLNAPEEGNQSKAKRSRHETVRDDPREVEQTRRL